ncbi:unnamed protein product, partial [Meganyctiphanes norvegica]
MKRLKIISLTSTDSNTMSLSSYSTNITTSEDLPDSLSATSPTTPNRPKSPFSSRAASPVSPSVGNPNRPRSPRRGSRTISPSPCASPTRRGSTLGQLASRRSSRDSETSDVAPLNYNRYKRRRPSNFLEIPIPDHFRPRVCSLPETPYNPRDGEDIYRLRSFSINPKGVLVNQGDHILSKKARSNTSVTSAASRRCASGERSPFNDLCEGSSFLYSEGSVPKYRVVLLGQSGVGKTSLVTQFMTSDYINTYDTSLDDEFGEKSVAVLLDDEESEVVFVDHPAHEMSVENMLSTYDPHACIVVYSITDKSSFKKAENIMNYLWREKTTKEKAVIVCGNKVDLARARTVKIAAGKSLASCHDSKFIETSSGIQHNVDELLVGIVKQIRLRLSLHRKQMKKASNSRASLSLHAAKELLSKLCLIDNKSKSCENLHVL